MAAGAAAVAATRGGGSSKEGQTSPATEEVVAPVVEEDTFVSEPVVTEDETFVSEPVVAETVVVSSQAPLVDTTSPRVSGNIDRRQMAELPLQGRNWMELSLMVKGITANSIGNTPGVPDDQFQLNLDGQQISQRISG